MGEAKRRREARYVSNSQEELAMADAFLAFVNELLAAQPDAEHSPLEQMNVHVQLGADALVRAGAEPSMVVVGLARGVACVLARSHCQDLEASLALFDSAVRRNFAQAVEGVDVGAGPVGHA
jgi:hypothetical protein